MEIFAAVPGPLVAGRYMHWDELRRRKPPEGLSLEEWWAGLKILRSASARFVPLVDMKGGPFSYSMPDPVLSALHEADLRAGGSIESPSDIRPGEHDRYLVASLMEEAVASSQLEGAHTTRRQARDMIRSERKPRSRDEQMVLNNYLTMRHIETELSTRPLGVEDVLDVHRVVTEGTLDNPDASGRLRRPDEAVDVADVTTGEPAHQPPPAGELERRLSAMCEFANGGPPDQFVHPVLRSIVLHFWLAYDHPFVDGNGRTARALFYWSMLRRGYWLFRFVSISPILRNAHSQYARAFLHTETDDNDLTYFVIHQLDVIDRAVRRLHDYVARKSAETRRVEELLRGDVPLNHRQKALLAHALRHPNHVYTVRSHQRSHNTIYETARTDLMDLRGHGLLLGEKVGRAWHFTPVRGLEAHLRGWGEGKA